MHSDNELIELYRSTGLPEAYALHAVLEQAGLWSVVENELLQGAPGEIPLGWNTTPRLKVRASSEAEARLILKEFLNESRSRTRKHSPEEDDECCLACGGQMGESHKCRICGWSWNSDARPGSSPRSLAIEIWRAGVAAVASETLVGNQITIVDSRLTIAGHEFDLHQLDRLLVVGCGKAGAGMAAGVENSLGADLTDRLVSGVVNVPADCVRPLRKIELLAARPAGVNEPTESGVSGAARIRQFVSEMTDRDLCLVLISGGGSALLPLPVNGISLADKQVVTRKLMLGGATINELNCVRKQLSQIKGGGLARAATQGLLIALIISDVIGDPLDVIASGPTVDDPSTPHNALAVLTRLVPQRDEIPESVWQYLEQAAAVGSLANKPAIDPRRVFNHVIGNNAVAIAAAAAQAQELGFPVLVHGAGQGGVADDVGRELAAICRSIRDCGDPVAAPVCILSGGEPIVQLAETSLPRKGGRNQQLVLAAAQELLNDSSSAETPDSVRAGVGVASEVAKGIVILSGGTDGEDGPTDAAGAVLDPDTLLAAQSLQLDPAPFLAINNSYAWFEQTDSLLKTGPTHTNVMDLRVALVQPVRQ